jgi:uncharacterized membrane protein YhhN
MISGLFFSWLGDIFLLPEDSDGMYFILGLSCFLTTHILYIIYFAKIRPEGKSFFRQYPFLLVFIGVYGAGLLYLLLPSLGGLKIPVAVYAINSPPGFSPFHFRCSLVCYLRLHSCDQ